MQNSIWMRHKRNNAHLTNDLQFAADGKQHKTTNNMNQAREVLSFASLVDTYTYQHTRILV